MDWQDFLVEEGRLIIAALAGGLVRLYFRPQSGFFANLTMVAACMACSYYLTPLVMMFTGWGAEVRDPLAAVIGFLGLSVAEGLLRVDWRKVAQDRLAKSDTPSE